MYWDTVLKETVNKEETSFDYTVTNLKKEKEPSDACIIEAPRKKILITPNRKKIKRYFLGAKYPDVYFTEREAETIFYSSKGKTAPQVAKIVKLSARTIEYYIKNMKDKLQCRSKIELLQKVQETDFFEEYNRNN